MNFCRYLNRTAKHATLRVDSDFREFLEAGGDLPRSTSTSALSGAGVMRLFSKVGDSFGKMTFKMDETDQVTIFLIILRFILHRIMLSISCDNCIYSFY